MKPLLNKAVRSGVKLFFTLFLVFVPALVWAQITTELQFTKKRQRIRFPFEWQSNLIVVPVQINQSDTLNLILDTGIGMTLLTDPAAAAAANMQYVRTVQIVGVGDGNPLEALVAINNQITLPGLEATGQSVVALSEDVLHLSNYVGMPIHGVLGFSLFQRYPVKIDFNKKLITFYKPGTYKHRGKGEKIPIIIEDAKPYLDATAVWADNEAVPIRVILDTGAGHALSLDMATHEQIRLPDKIIRAQLGRGLNGVVMGSLGRIHKVQIGKYELEDVITSFPDTTSLAAQIAKRVNRHGNIGCELLRRFDVVFNYSEQYIVLKPNRRSFKASFERDMSGLDLRAKGDNFQQYIIDRVEEGSPAKLAGLEEGDEIVSVNGLMSHELTLSEIFKMLQRKEGKEIRMIVRRGNQFIFSTFQLKRAI
jgi:hypothetical protein